MLICVLTAAEGVGLEKMACGLMARFANACEPQPKTMYVDRDCCSMSGESKVHKLFSQWPNMAVRLDIYHFIRRLASGCTTDAHQLYGTYMAGLSSSIFEWDAHDVAELKRAKRAEMEKEGLQNISPAMLGKKITRNEMALHCRRRTRGAAETTRLITELVKRLDSDKGRDTLGVPLLDSDKIWAIWETQKKHVACIQDPEGVQLYTEKGTCWKGGVELKIYKSGRGSTSLESYHLHLNRFIPGKTCIHYCTFILTVDIDIIVN